MKHFVVQHCCQIVLFLCVIISFTSYAQTEIDSENFESGSFPFTMWNDGGAECRVNSKSRLSGVYSLVLRGNTSSSNTYTNSINLSSYESITIEFDFKTRNYDSGEDFFIEFSNDGGSTWHNTPVLHYVHNTDFNNNIDYTNVTVTVLSSNYTFTSISRFRFRSNPSETKERLFLDDILIIGQENTGGPEIVDIDTDTDGIKDALDVDDDNDGILDCTEKGITYGTISEVFTLSGTAIEISNTEFQLTDALNSQAGAATIVDRINFSDSFSFSFDAFLGDNDSGADGMAIIFHNDPNGASAVGDVGEGLGVSGIQNGIVLELDTYNNGSSRGDQWFDHGMIWDSDNQSGVGLLTSATYLGELENGNWHTIIINWDASKNTISYYVGNTLAGTYTGDLINNYFGGNNLVFFGFSASTGALNNTQKVRFNSVCDIPLFIDTDNDGLANKLDLDSDNDGIPDNIEAQTTLGYILPSGAVNTSGNYAGLWNNYGTGILPEDTDLDKIYDYVDLNSDNDDYNDIEENGMSNTILSADDDNDGLDNAFETNGANDANWDVNEDIEAPSDLSILPDVDSDVNSGGDLDYRDTAQVIVYPSSASIDFDGVNDYLGGDSILNGLEELTIMAWIKIDTDNNNDDETTILGEDFGCRLYTDNGNTVKFEITTPSEYSYSVEADKINFEEWHHVTTVFSSKTGTLAIYIDGEIIDTETNSILKGAIISPTSNWTGDFEVGRISSSIMGRQYFKGEIDEVRVFNESLTDSQIQTMIYQEIKENSGTIKGAVIPKDIIDFTSKEKVSWSSLIAYYPMTNIAANQVEDYSQNSNDLTMHNISSVMEQTAPMPYKTFSDGNWNIQDAWEYGNVWDIEELPSSREWSIIKIENNVTISNSISTYGLIIDNGNTLTVNGNNLIKNTGYLELNGTLDLMNDSQLIQTSTSDLVTSADGKTLRRQEGTPNAYWYNYWSSPTGATGVSTLVDNNSASGNPNNSNFSLELLKDESGFNCQFTSAYTANGNISTYWLYAFKNGKTYWDWVRLKANSNIEPGVGYTQKGTGVTSKEQQYIFEGKPNNGTILVNVQDVGGPGSVPDVSRTSYLLGNPYTSSIDIHKFIDDNTGVIDGTLQFWQQWSGSSHNLNEYNGGYAQVNKLGSTRAYQFVGLSGAHNGSQEGTLVPSRYLPIGQGFITEIIADGNVEFNNSQRVFVLEKDADGSYDNGSVFLKNTKSKSIKTSKSASQESNSFKKMRIEFSSVTGPDTRRELLLGFSENTSDSFDYGFDSECNEVNNNDLNLNLDGKNMNIQAYSKLTENKVIPINFKSSGQNSFEILLTELENFDETHEIYLKDNLTGDYFDLRSNEPYSFNSEQGKFNERFEIVFQSEQQSLSVDNVLTDQNFIYYLGDERRLYVKKLSSSLTRMSVISISGKIIMELNNISSQDLNSGIEIPNVASGAYIVYFRTNDSQVLTKKIIIN